MLYAKFYEELKKKHVVISNNIKIADYFAEHQEFNVHVLDIGYAPNGMPCLFEFSYDIDLLLEIYEIIDGYDEEGRRTGQGYYLDAPIWVGKVINKFFDEKYIIEFKGEYCNIYKKKVYTIKCIECVNGTIILSGAKNKVAEALDWLKRLSGKHGIKVNIMIDEAEIFSFCYGDKNDGLYESVGYGKNYYIRHPEPAKCFGIVDVEPLEDGGYVWRNFEDFDVDVEYNIEYNCKEYNLSPTPKVYMNHAQKCVIMHHVEEHEKKAEEDELKKKLDEIASKIENIYERLEYPSELDKRNSELDSLVNKWLKLKGGERDVVVIIKTTQK